MLRPRIIPCLLLKDKGLVKTVNFKNPKYVGDPINTVYLFNEKQADELIVLDIDVTAKKTQINYQMIENLASECQMPLCYGGGINTVEEALRIFSLGVEKIALSSAAVTNPQLISEIAARVGTQSVTVVIDVKKKLSGKYEIYTHNGKNATGLNPVEYVKYLETLGAGEIVINSIDNDGMMKGYDLTIIEQIRKNISLPITALGGAGSLADIGKLIEKFGIIGAGAGSLFVFKGKYKAVLINYPNNTQKNLLIKENFEII